MRKSGRPDIHQKTREDLLLLHRSGTRRMSKITAAGGSYQAELLIGTGKAKVELGKTQKTDLFVPIGKLTRIEIDEMFPTKVIGVEV